MDDTKKSFETIYDLKEDLTHAALEEMAKGIQNVNTHEMSEVVDMIKDLAEAEEKCWKACYYKSIVNAMHEEEEETRRSGGRMGYDNWRYSSGRFAPTGHGHRSGYTPGDDDYEEMVMADAWTDRNSDTKMDGHRMGTSGRMGYPGHPRGDRYERYHQARMGYHESKDAASRQHMDAAARDYVVDMAEVVKEIWKDADPAMRKELKNKVVALSGELN